MALNAHPDPSAAQPAPGFQLDEAQAAMRRMLEEQAAATDRLVQELQRRERERKRLEKSVEQILEQEEMSGGLPEILAGAEAQYQQLQARVAEQEREITELRKLRRNIQEQELLIQNLRRLLHSKEQSLTDVLDALEQQGQEVQGIQQALHGKEEELAQRGDQLARQMRAVQQLQKEIAQLESRVRQGEQTAERLRELEVQHDERTAETERLREQVGSLAQGHELAAREQRLLSREQELEAVRVQLQQMQAEVEVGRQATEDLKRLGRALLKKDNQLQEARAEIDMLRSQGAAGPAAAPAAPPRQQQEADWHDLLPDQDEHVLELARLGQAELPRWETRLLDRAGLLEPQPLPGEAALPPILEEDSSVPPPPPLLEEQRQQEMAAVEPVFDMPTIAAPARHPSKRVRKAKGKAARPAPAPTVPPRGVPRMETPPARPTVASAPEIILEEPVAGAEGLGGRLRRIFGSKQAPAAEPAPRAYEPEPEATLAASGEPTTLPFDQEDLWAPQDVLGEALDEPEEDWQAPAPAQKWRPGRAAGQRAATAGGERLLDEHGRPVQGEGQPAADEPPAARDWRSVLRRFRPKRIAGEALSGAEPGPELVAYAAPAPLDAGAVPASPDADMQQLKEKIEALDRSLREHRAIPPLSEHEAESEAAAMPEGAQPTPAAPDAAQLSAAAAELHQAIRQRERQIELEIHDLMKEMPAPAVPVDAPHTEQPYIPATEPEAVAVPAAPELERQLSEHSEQVKSLREDLQQKAAELSHALQEIQEHPAEVPPEVVDHPPVAEVPVEHPLVDETPPEIVEHPAAAELLVEHPLVDETPPEVVDHPPVAEVPVEHPLVDETPPQVAEHPPVAEVPALPTPEVQQQLAEHSEQLKSQRGDLQQKAAELAQALEEIQGQAAGSPAQPPADVAELRRSIREREAGIEQEIQRLAGVSPTLPKEEVEIPLEEEPSATGKASLWERLLTGFRRGDAAAPATGLRSVILYTEPDAVPDWQEPVASFLAQHRLAARWRAVGERLSADEMASAAAIVYLYPQAGWEPQPDLEAQAATRDVAFHQWPLRNLARLQIDLMDQLVGYAEA